MEIVIFIIVLIMFIGFFVARTQLQEERSGDE